MQAASEQSVIDGYRVDVADRMRVCAVTREPLDTESAVHLVLPDGIPTGYVFTPEGARLFAANPTQWVPEIDTTWRLE